MRNRDNYDSGRDQGRYDADHRDRDSSRTWDRDQPRHFDRPDEGRYGRHEGEQSYGRPGQYSGWRGQDRSQSDERDYGEASNGRNSGQSSGGGFGAEPYRGEQQRGPSAQGGGTYDQQDYSRAAQRSRSREDQRYGYQASTGEVYNGGYSNRGDDNYGGGPSRAGHYSADQHDHEPHYRRWRDQQLSDHDRDYARWRDQQARRYDDEYGAWRNERHDAFSKDFHSWRENRQQGDSPTGTTGDASGLGGASSGASGAQVGQGGPETGWSGNSGGATGAAQISGASNSAAGYPGAGAPGTGLSSVDFGENSRRTPSGSHASAGASGSPVSAGDAPDAVQSVTDGHKTSEKKDDK